MYICNWSVDCSPNITSGLIIVTVLVGEHWLNIIDFCEILLTQWPWQQLVSRHRQLSSQMIAHVIAVSVFVEDEVVLTMRVFACSSSLELDRGMKSGGGRFEYCIWARLRWATWVRVGVLFARLTEIIALLDTCWWQSSQYAPTKWIVLDSGLFWGFSKRIFCSRRGIKHRELTCWFCLSSDSLKSYERC